MKRVNMFMIAAFVAASAMFVSCEKDDDPDNAPTVIVKATYGTVNSQSVENGASIEGDEGVVVTFDIKFTMGISKLKEVHMKATIGSKTFNVLDSVGLDKGLFNSGSEFIDFKYVTNIGVQQETLTFTSIDTKDRQGTSSVVIKVKEVAPPGDVETGESYFVTKSATLLGGQANATYGSFYSVEFGKVMTIGAATSQSSSVDFAYFHGATNGATIAAPANADAQTISYGQTKMSSWSTKNSTKFYKVEGADGTKPEDWWDEAIDGATTDTYANQLTKDAVVVFKTQGGTQGAFYVQEVKTGTTGSISIILIEKRTKE